MHLVAKLLFPITLIIGFLLRIAYNSVPLVSDTGKYILNIDYPGAGVKIFYALAKLGVTPEVIALTTALASLVTIVAVYKTIDKHDKGIALASAIFLSVLFPSAIVLSKTLKLDIFIAMFWAIATYAYVQIAIEQKEEAKYYALIFISILAAGLIKPQGIVIAVMLFVHRICKKPINLKKSIKDTLNVTIVLSCIPYALSFVANPHRVWNFYEYFFLLNTTVNQGIAAKIIEAIQGLVFNDGVIFPIAFIAALALGKIQSENAKKRQIINLARYQFFFLTTLFLLVFSQSTYYKPLLSLPYALVIGALAVAFYKKRKRAAVILATLLIINVVLFATPLGDNNLHTTYVREETNIERHAEQIHQIIGEQEAILIGNGFGHEFQYHLEYALVRTCALENNPEIDFAIITNEAPSCEQQTKFIQENWQEMQTFETTELVSQNLFAQRQITIYQKPK